MTREWEEAVHRGSLDDLKQLAESGADINARDRHNQTALMLAATEGHTAVVEWLVRGGAALNHVAKYGLSALMLAVVRGHGEIVRVLAEAGADVRLRGSGPPGFAGLAALDHRGHVSARPCQRYFFSSKATLVSCPALTPTSLVCLPSTG